MKVIPYPRGGGRILETHTKLSCHGIEHQSFKERTTLHIVMMTISTHILETWKSIDTRRLKLLQLNLSVLVRVHKDQDAGDNMVRFLLMSLLVFRFLLRVDMVDAVDCLDFFSVKDAITERKRRQNAREVLRRWIPRTDSSREGGRKTWNQTSH